MEKNESVKKPAYDWVNTLSGKLIVALASTTNLYEGIYNQFFSRWALSETKFNALLLLYKNEGMALWELGEAMLVSRANITGLMDRLEKSGLVTREINQADRRSLTAKLTSKSEALLEEIIPEFNDFNRQVMQGLNDEEKMLLIHLLSKLSGEAEKSKS